VGLLLRQGREGSEWRGREGRWTGREGRGGGGRKREGDRGMGVKT